MPQPIKTLPKVDLYTDGGSKPNPGLGGLGFILCHKGQCKEFARGYHVTTNNRMELMAVIFGLARLKTKSTVTIHADSKYVIDGIQKGWAKKWRAKAWMRNAKEPAINADLWEQLLHLVERHEVSWRWIKGHSGHPKNERCDQLATWARTQAKQQLHEDKGYQ